TTDAFATTLPVLTSSIRAARTTVIRCDGVWPIATDAIMLTPNTACAIRAPTLIQLTPAKERSELPDERPPLIHERAIIGVVISGRQEPASVVRKRLLHHVPREEIAGRL